MPASKGEEGQILIVMAVSGLVLILFMGLAVDGGMAYITKAKLSKAVDAACLTGMKALPQGQPTATTLATHIFNANYGPNPPTPTITFPKDAYGDQQVNVIATAKVPTFFAQHFFQFWNVSDTAVATRGKLVMALILDRSGSMANNGGGTALKSAVPSFVNDFDNTLDSVTMISYASHARVDFAIATNFKTPITNLINGWNNNTFTGGTFGTGGTYVASKGPPLALADNQISSVPIQPGQNVTRVAVYFTDGLMNTIQDTFTCYTSSKNSVNVLLNYGGFDADVFGHPEVDVFDPVSGTDWCPNTGNGSCVADSHGNELDYEIVYNSAGAVCQNPYNTPVTRFTSQQNGSQLITRANVTADSQYRAIQTANTMRAENPGVYIYTIGLSSAVDATFLKQLANDPTSTTYNPNLPVGQYFPVLNCPSSACTTQLNTAFQTIAAKILLRLTQ
jgi:Flp pilus assembly protein TadG